jgi:cytochrome c oxidase subunit IV
MSAHSHEHTGSTPKTIWKTFWILLAITIGEIIYALTLSHVFGKVTSNILYAVLSVMKAGYIISEFMHMKYETKNLIRTVGLPLTLLLWVILSYMMESNSWKHMMNKKVPAVVEAAQKEGASHHE